MKTVNSLSGGQTSSYIAANYPADYNVFALIRTSDLACKFPDKKIRQEVSDRIGVEFIGTLEDDLIIYTMLDLEQFIGHKIHWVTGKTFDEIIDRGNGKKYLPNVVHRFCTLEMKLQPIFEWWNDNFSEPIEMRIGYRADEQYRAVKMNERANADGFQTFKAAVGVKKIRKSNGHICFYNRYQNVAWQKAIFPLIENVIFKDSIFEFWKNKPVRFAYRNNCIGCFHRNEILLNFMSKLHPEKFDWFCRQEQNKYKKITFKNGITYSKIRDCTVNQLSFDSFTECDSGGCEI